MTKSPYGLKSLIRTTFSFAKLYGDSSFNVIKSWILRKSPYRNKPPVSLCGIPVTECQTYLGVQIGRKAQPAV